MSDRPPSQPNSDNAEISYLLCKDCGTPCYVFEAESGRVSEALCLACGNEAVAMFTAVEREDDET